MSEILYNLICRKDYMPDNPVYDETVVDMLILIGERLPSVATLA